MGKGSYGTGVKAPVRNASWAMLRQRVAINEMRAVSANQRGEQAQKSKIDDMARCERACQLMPAARTSAPFCCADGAVAVAFLYERA